MLSIITKFIAPILCLAILVGCTHSREAFRAKIKSMSDMELVGYYEGLNDRIKSIENNETLNRRSDTVMTETVISQSTFFFGGEGHELVQKQKEVRKEMVRRNIYPE